MARWDWTEQTSELLFEAYAHCACRHVYLGRVTTPRVLLFALMCMNDRFLVVAPFSSETTV